MLFCTDNSLQSCSLLEMKWTFFSFADCFMYEAGVKPSALWLRKFIELLYQLWMRYIDDCGAIRGMNEWQDKPKYAEETCPSAALSTTDPTRLEQGSNPGRRGGKPASTGTTYPYFTAHQRLRVPLVEKLLL
jgi:hypothetical protein